MTGAYTYVFISENNNNCHVYFDGAFAYTVPYSDVFMEDVVRCNMESVSGKIKYIKAAKNEI